MNNEIAKIEFLPMNSLADLKEAGKLLAQSCMFGAKNEAEGFVIACTCQQERMSLLEFQRTYDIIDNKPSMKADAMLAGLVLLGGTYDIISRTSELAEIKVSIDGREHTDRFSWEEAQDERYIKDKNDELKFNWSTPRKRKQMLWARLVSDVVRAIAPQVVKGIYTPEEVADFDKPLKVEKEINPEKAAGMVPVKDETPQPAVDVKASPDFDRCPLDGSMLGRHWNSMDDDTLKQALQVRHETMRKGHFDAIMTVIDARAKEDILKNAK